VQDGQARQLWQRLEGPWVASFGVQLQPSCIRQVSGDVFMWEDRCIQGCVHGSQSFFWAEGEVAELCHREGWVRQPVGDGRGELEWFKVMADRIQGHTVHVRVFSQFDISGVPLVPLLSDRCLVMEWSRHETGSSSLPFGCEAWLRRG
jgi:hypothetical protein